jgi:AcrR family transcriptional regulator
MPRLTRKEKQAKTRSCLIESAAKVFARRGLQQASIDEVAEDAGFTKGAFYANFKSKEELFLAMLDERFQSRIEELDRVLASEDEPTAQARRAGDDFIRFLEADPEWPRLFFEFAAYAARNDDFREELVTRYRSLRDRLAEIYRLRAAALGVEPAMDPEQLALVTFAIANGFALEQMLEPGAIPSGLHGRTLETFFSGLVAQAGRPAGAR